jgi:hypothetical protein
LTMLRDEKPELAPPPAELEVRIIHAMCAIAQTGEGRPSILFTQATRKSLPAQAVSGKELLAMLTQANQLSGRY